jgi:hypothetical protein
VVAVSAPIPRPGPPNRPVPGPPPAAGSRGDPAVVGSHGDGGQDGQEGAASIAALQAAVADLDRLDDLPVADHVVRYDALHGTLSEALAAIDGV